MNYTFKIKSLKKKLIFFSFYGSLYIYRATVVYLFKKFIYMILLNIILVNICIKKKRVKINDI